MADMAVAFAVSENSMYEVGALADVLDGSTEQQRKPMPGLLAQEPECTVVPFSQMQRSEGSTPSRL